MKEGGEKRARTLRFAAFAAAFYGLILVVYLWPWTRDPGSLAMRNDDLLLHAWSLSFVVRQTVHDPLHLFEANMFWPRRDSLALTETLFPQSLLAAPIVWLGGGALLAHNLVLFASVVLSGIGAALLALRLTGSRGAALIAGFGFAFCPFRFQHLVQLGIASYQWFPFVLLALWNIAAKRRARSSFAGLAAFSVMQALSSGYYAVLLAFVLTSAVAFLAPRLRRRGRLGGLAISLGAAALLAALAGLPSARLRETQAVSRGLEGPIHWSAVPRSYVDPGPNVPALGLRGVVEPTPEPLFPGFLVTAFAIAGLVLARNRAARGLALSTGIVCALMACGPIFRDLPFEPRAPFELVRHIPPADMIRAPSRFGVGVLLAIAVAAALGFAAIERRLSGRLRPFLLACALACMIAEARPSLSHAIVGIPEPPPVARALAALPRAGTIELPWPTEESAGLYLYWSTAHWQPLVNGYGGFSMPDNFGLAAMAQNFPTGFATRVLRCAGVRYVVLHGARVDPAQLRRALEFEPPGAKRLGRYEEDVLFELQPWNEGVECATEIPPTFKRR
jgi:hypothetical protein